MDLKSKGIRWVESIYQTFETVCEDVDIAMSQAPMKYPVHRVGKGVKKLCSSAMQDLLPPVKSGNDDVCEVSPEESDYIEGFIVSKNMEENELYMSGEQPVEVYGEDCGANQGAVNLNSLLSSSPGESPEPDDNETNAVCNSFDSGIDAVTIQDAISQTNISCLSAITEVPSSLIGENPHADPDHDFEHIEIPCYGSDRSSSVNALFQMNVSYRSAITNPTSSDMVEKPRSNSNPYHENEHIERPRAGSDKISPPNSIISPSVTILDTPTNVIVGNAVVKFEQNETFQRANSSECITILPESFGVDPFRVRESETLPCSSRSVAEKGQGSSAIESSMMFSDICISDDRSDSEPLAEDFSIDEIKLIHPDLFSNRDHHFPSSHRRPSLKSYKKLLQRTLNSKRRLVKEYEQLGIWHGDIYEEQEPVTTKSLPTNLTTRNQDLSEWELL